MGEAERLGERSIGSAVGEEIMWFWRAAERSGMVEAVASSIWGVGSLRRAEGGGVLAGEDFCGEMDLARSVGSETMR